MKRRTRKQADAADFVVHNSFSWNSSIQTRSEHVGALVGYSFCWITFWLNNMRRWQRLSKWQPIWYHFVRKKMSFLFIYVYCGYERQISIHMCSVYCAIYSHLLCEIGLGFFTNRCCSHVCLQLKKMLDRLFVCLFVVWVRQKKIYGWKLCCINTIMQKQKHSSQIHFNQTSRTTNRDYSAHFIPTGAIERRHSNRIGF